MRCYFFRDHHIVAVEVLARQADTIAIDRARRLFEQRKGRYSGFEVWDGARFIYRFPAPSPPTDAGKPGRMP